MKTTLRLFGVFGALLAAAGCGPQGALSGKSISSSLDAGAEQVPYEDPSGQALETVSTLRTVAGWESLYNGIFAANHSSFLPMSTSADSWQIYNIAYGIDGPTAMFEATGNTKYLDQALLYVNNIISTAKLSSSLPGSTYRDSYLGWGNYSHPQVQDGNEYPLYESYGWRYVTEMLRAMRQNPAVYGNATYRAKYDSILAFTKKHIFEKWMTRNPAHIYRVNTHMASHWAFISLNLYLLTDNTTEKAKYKTVVDNINLHMPNYSSSLRQQMRLGTIKPGAYFWSDTWASYARPGQDVSHGNAVIAYVIAARNAGIEWNDTDMQAFAKTLLDVMWIPNSTGGYTYAYYVDGTGAGNGWFSDGFIKLGRFSATIQKRLETHDVGRGIQLYGHGALNAKILLSGSVAPSPTPTATPAPVPAGSLAVASVIASANDGNVPANAVDGNLSTRWSCDGVGCYIRLDLGSSKSVNGAKIAWYVGDSRQSNFVIDTSSDGVTFASAYSGQSSGTTADLESYSFAARNARYVRITVNGNTANTWASISEVQVIGSALSAPSPTPTVTQAPSPSPTPTATATTAPPATLPVSAVIASANDGNVPANAIDGNLSTRWSCNGVGCYIQLDLGSSKSVNGAKIAWYVGDSRKNNFVIATSSDGVTFASAYSGQSSGTTAGLESYSFAARSARYARITVNGTVDNSTGAAGTWASISEIQVMGGALASPSPTPTVSAAPSPTPTPTVTSTSPVSGPFFGTPATVPGKIEAENFDNGGEGLAYHDLSSGNVFGAYRTTDVDVGTCSEGGYRVGHVEAGEWLSYTVNVTTTGTYTLQIRSASTVPSVTYFKVGQTDVSGPISLPNTGSWSTYVTTSKTGIPLTAGRHVISLYNDSGNVDYNYIDLVLSSISSPSPTATATPSPTPTATQTPVDLSLQPITYWENLFLGVWASSDTEGTSRSLSKDSWQFYNLAYIIDANVKMFEATGKTQYLDRALKYTFNMMNTAVTSSSLPGSTFKDSYKAWGSYTHPQGATDGNEYPLFESYCWRYVTQMLKAMKKNAAVYGNSTYKTKYDQVMAFTKQHIFNKWKARGANSHIYRVNTHMASHWALISLNLWLLTDDLTEKAVYKEVVDNINLHLPNYSASLRGQMRVGTIKAGAMYWSDTWGSTARPGQDVSHGNAVITYVIEARNAGVEWTDADLRAFTNTLTSVIWIPTSTGLQYAAYVDGSGTGNGWINDGFAALGRYSATVQKRLETYNVGRGVQLYAHGALNAKILNGR